MAALTSETRSTEAERATRVQQQDLLVDRWTEARFLEVGEPALGGDERVVTTEEHLVLEQRVGELHVLWGDVFGRVAAQVEVYVGLVTGNGQAFVGPWPGRVGGDDGQVWKISRQMVQVNGSGVVQSLAAPARGASASGHHARVEQHWDVQ